MYRPFVFVGLGGSGGKTLRFLKAGLRGWLEEHGWDEPGMPEAWQFLHIDTPTIPDGKELNQFVPMLEPGEYVGLVGDGVNYQAVANALDNIDGMSDELLGWRIDPVTLGVPIGVGAGQFRAVGRTVAMLQGKTVRSRLRNSFDRVKKPQARHQLGSLYSKATGLAPSGAYPPPIVVVISSLAGGTGAGLLVNVCDLLREMEDGIEPLAVLYTPEVFGNIAGGGVHPNSLAAISEILNGHWLNGSGDGGSDRDFHAVSSRRGRDLEHAGAARYIKASGPGYPFLVGIRNAAGNSFGTDRALFEMIGSAMVSWLTDVTVQDKLVAYVQTNWENAAGMNMPTPDVLVNTGSPGEQGAPAFNGLGVARLSIGLHYLERYSAERLALDAAAWVARAHTESDAAIAVIQQEGIREPDEIAARIALKELPWFLRRASISERGPEDDVINAIRPDSSQVEQRARELAYQLAEVGVGGTAPAATWEGRIINAVQKASSEYATGFLQLLHQKVADWVRDAPGVVLSAVEETIARLGVKVAAAMVRAAAAEFLNPDGVVAELRGPSELGSFANWASESTWALAVSGKLQSLGKKVENNHPAVPEAIEDALYSAMFIGEAHIRDIGAAMLQSFAELFLRPLAAELEGQAILLDDDLQGEPSNWSPWVSGPPPNRVLPPPSEITLIDPQNFSSIFDELLSKTYPTKSEMERRLEVRKEVTTGAFLRIEAENSGGTFRESPGLEVRAEWWPGTTVVPTELRTQSQALFKVRMRTEDLKNRASAWMRRPNSPFANMLRETMRTYLQQNPMFAGQSEPEQVYVARRRDFVPKLQAAIAASAPLINLDANLMRTLHPNMDDPPYSPIISQLPFKNHELEHDVTNVLMAVLGGDATEVEKMVTSDSLVSSIDIASFLSSPVSPLVIESLLRPIAEEWTTSERSRVQVQHFWLHRRARPLEEFIPAPQEHILAMCRGWFTGALLGLIDRSSSPIVIARTNDVPASFPRVTLSRSGDPRDLLPLLLESLSLAYVGVSQRGNLSPLSSYISLRNLGLTGIDDHSVLEYERVGWALEDWARSGVVSGAIVSPAVNGDSYAERLQSAKSAFESARSTYVSEYERLKEVWRKQPSKLGEPPYWPGIRRQIATALDQLITAINVALDDTGSRDNSALPL